MTPNHEESQRSLILERWRRLTNELQGSSRLAAEESERWFLTVVRGADYCTHWAEVVLAQHVFTRVGSVWRRGDTRERIERALRAEARRARAMVDAEEFSAFSEQVAALVDLVLRGAIPASCITFEEESPAPPDYSSTAEVSAE